MVLLATIWMQMSNWHEYNKINPKLFSLYPCLSRLPSTFSSGTVPLERSREDCSPGHFIRKTPKGVGGGKKQTLP